MTDYEASLMSERRAEAKPEDASDILDEALAEA